MEKRPTFTISIVGGFLLSALLAGLLAWWGPLVAHDAMPFKLGAGWSSAQYHAFAVATGVAVGLCAVAVLVVVRRLLPAQLRSRIVWLPQGFLDPAKLKKQGIEILVVLAMIALLLFAMHMGFLGQER